MCSWRSPPGRYRSLLLRRWHLKKHSSADEVNHNSAAKVEQWLSQLPGATSSSIRNETASAQVRRKLHFTQQSQEHVGPTSFSAMNVRKSKCLDTLRRKRKRYRQKKKNLIRQRKYDSTPLKQCEGDQDSGYTTSPNVRVSTASTSPAQCEGSHQAESVSSDSSDSLPVNKDWAVLDEEAKRIREVRYAKQAEITQKYSTYVDCEEAIVFDSTKPDLPQSITGIDRVLVTMKINNIMYREKKAVDQARVYREKCTQLEARCRTLEEEKEGIRYFWRNTLLESETRAAKMVQMSLKSKH